VDARVKKQLPRSWQNVVTSRAAARQDWPISIRVKAWWKKNGDDFLRGADVPNPNLQSVFSIR
jgi:hypothetical protein